MFRRPGTFFDILHARSGQTPGAYADAALAARSPLPSPSPHTPERAARTAAYFVAAAYCATAVGGGAATAAAACAVKKGVYLRQAKSADVVCM